MFSTNKRALMAAAAVWMLWCTWAYGRINFVTDTMIATGDAVSAAETVVDAGEPGVLDILWQGSDGAVYYSCFDDGVFVVDGQQVAAQAVAIMGVSRDGGTVTAGLNVGGHVMKFSCGGNGQWTSVDTGYLIAGTHYPCGAYDVNVTAGLAGFLFKQAATNDIVYVAETAGGTWTSTVLESNIDNDGFGNYADLRYTPAGQAVGAYKVRLHGTTTDHFRAGVITAGALTPLNVAYPDQHQGMAVTADGTVVLVDDYSLRYVFVYKMTPGGGFSYFTQMLDSPDSGDNGDGTDLAVAVSPDGQEISVLRLNYNNDLTSPLTLFRSTDAGLSYESQQLFGGGKSIASAAYDGNGDLYIVYYNAVDDELHLLSTNAGRVARVEYPFDKDVYADSVTALRWKYPLDVMRDDRLADVYLGTDAAAVAGADPCSTGADLNHDGVVGFVDFAMFCDGWLDSGAPAADLTGDGRVDMADFAVMSEQWQAWMPGIYKGRVDGKTCEHEPLVDGETYYWRVDVVDPCTGIADAGDVWSFTVNDLIFTPEAYGAVGDGITDDTDAMVNVADALEAAGGGTLRLGPGKVYCVGQQIIDPDPDTPYYQEQPLPRIENTRKRKVILDGQGGTIQFNDDLGYGIFNPETGEPFDPCGPDDFYYDKWHADIGIAMLLANNRRVEVRDVLFDGNVNNLTIGGHGYGRDCAGTGLYLRYNEYAYIHDVESSYCPLDGFIFTGSGPSIDDPCRPVYVDNIQAYYNGRQGLSYTGGIGLTMTDSIFAYTGRNGSYATAPQSGMDIEPGTGFARYGSFYNCQFVNNAGMAMVSGTTRSSQMRFHDCLFWGTTSWAVWVTSPDYNFYDCTFYGTRVHCFNAVDPNDGTKHYNCHFEDYDGYYDGQWLTSYRRTALITVDRANHAVFDGCTIVANGFNSLYLGYTTSREQFINCDITHNNTAKDDHGYMALLRGAYFENTRFHENLGNDGKLYYIVASEVTVGPGVYVDGPQCKWGSWSSGLTGLIPETP